MSSQLADNYNRLKFFRWLTAATIIITILATWSLWSCDRASPTAPIIGIQSFISGNAGVIFKVAIIIFAAMFALSVTYSEWILTGLLIVAFADDMNRLLPNTYHLCVVIILFALAHKTKSEKLLIALRIIQAGSYLWTGLLKLNSSFVNQVSQFSFSALHINQHLPYLKYSVLLIALWEILIGLSFLTGYKTRVAIYSAVLMHLGICVVLINAQWNQVIVTYNLFLVASNFILFSGTSYTKLLSSPTMLRGAIPIIAIALFLILPAANLVRWWPDFMSCSLYSCRSLSAGIFIDQDLRKKLPPSAIKAVSRIEQGEYISVTHWVQYETGTVPNPQKVVYQKMFEQVKATYNCSDSVRLEIY